METFTRNMNFIFIGTVLRPESCFHTTRSHFASIFSLRKIPLVSPTSPKVRDILGFLRNSQHTTPRLFTGPRGQKTSCTGTRTI
jgi:hypothetical protein